MSAIIFFCLQCPVFDLLTNVELRGRHQTVTRKGAITLQRSQSNNSGMFFVVLVATPSDFDCRTVESVVPGMTLLLYIYIYISVY